MTDEASAPQIGGLLGAQYLVVGSVLFPDEAAVVVNFKILETESGRIRGAGRVAGERRRMLRLQNTLSRRVQSELQELFPSIVPGELPVVPEGRHAESGGPAAQPGMQALTDFGRALDLKDRREYREAALVLERLTAELPELSYAQEELSKVRARLELYNRNRRARLQAGSAAEEGPDWNTFVKTLLSYSSAMEFRSLLRYCEEVEDKLPSPPPESIQSGEELLLYNRTYALHSLGRIEAAVRYGEEFLRRYPTSLYYQSVRAFVNQDLQKLEAKRKIEAGLDDRMEELLLSLDGASDEAERQYYLFLIAEYLQSLNLHADSLTYLDRIDIETLTQRGITGDRLLFTRFYCYYSLKQRENAEAVLEKVKRSYPDSDYLRSMESMILWAGD
jgi:tetratricopeptide (TPR) repeat protein